MEHLGRYACLLILLILLILLNILASRLRTSLGWRFTSDDIGLPTRLRTSLNDGFTGEDIGLGSLGSNRG